MALLNTLCRYCHQVTPYRLILMLLLALCPWTVCQAKPFELTGQWLQAPQQWQYQQQSQLNSPALIPVTHPKPTGGHYFFQADFDVTQLGTLVIDFKNASVLGQFRHFVFDRQGQLVAQVEGGIQNHTANPFFLRHGRELQLAPGNYRLVTELSSPFFIAQPQPYIDSLENYRQAIKPGNALSLICMGVFLGLGIYYLTLAGVRQRRTESMYALFILGNLLYNGTALLIFPDLFGTHWFYLISIPILFSNIAYVLFVQSLLDIRRDQNPRLYWAGIAIIGLMVVFIGLAALYPNWSLEFDRYGVGLFLTYGLVSGITRARQGNHSARYYLVAILAFCILGFGALTLGGFGGEFTLYVEHLGLVAVTVEVILLALVLSYQFSQLHREKEHALSSLKHTQHIALTDALTGLPNRYALEDSLAQLPAHGSLTFLDIDGLKYYNDHFGHDRGDVLLREFSHILRESLASHGKLHRLGGDEFAITCPSGNLDPIKIAISQTMEALHARDFEFAGASHGSVHIHEHEERGYLMHMADTRMYESKRNRKTSID
ncbi:MAG: diguanylate cyclase [Candidatus Methylopumilus sp.]